MREWASVSLLLLLLLFFQMWQKLVDKYGYFLEVVANFAFQIAHIFSDEGLLLLHDQQAPLLGCVLLVRGALPHEAVVPLVHHVYHMLNNNNNNNNLINLLSIHMDSILTQSSPIRLYISKLNPRHLIIWNLYQSKENIFFWLIWYVKIFNSKINRK